MSDVSDLDILLAAADIADRESMATWRSDDLEVEIKPDGSPVSATDKLIERLLRELLAEHRPHDRILGEEEGGETGIDLSTPGGRCWVIDPIDGTESFVAGRRAWSTLLGLEVDGRPVAGVVSMPAVGRRWWGTASGGAFVVELADGSTTPISVSAHTDRESIRWTTGPTLDELRPSEQAQVAHLDDHGTFVPADQWTTYPALMVAAGELELAVQFGHHWDHSAHSAVVIAAGGDVSVAPAPVAGQRFAATSTNARLGSAAGSSPEPGENDL
jgi:histidinol-phosphatase